MNDTATFLAEKFHEDRIKPQRILVVEDNATDVALLSTVLARENILLIRVATVAEALTTLSQVEVAAAVVDLKLPDGTGIEILKFIHEKKPDLPVVVLTALEDKAEIERVAAMGVPVLLKTSGGLAHVPSALKKFGIKL